MKLSDAIAATARSGPTSKLRLGVVTASASGLLSVRIQDTVHDGIRYLSAYSSPTAGDQVVLSAVGNQWIVLGKLSRSQEGVNVSSLAIDSSARYWYPAAGFTWTTGPVWQGVYSSGSPFELRGVWLYPSRLVPVGATILSAKLTIEATETVSYLVEPMITAHGYPDAPTGAPSWSHGPVSAGSAANGQTVTVDIPSTWWADIEAGTITGFGLSADTYANRMSSGTSAPDGRFTVTYTQPPSAP